MALVEVYTDGNALQFTENQYPFNLKDKIVLDLSNFGTPRTQGGNTNSKPVVYYEGAVQISPGVSIVAANSNTLFSFGAVSNGYVPLQVGNRFGTITIYTFGKGSATGSANSGLTVWGPDGTIAFTADDKPLKPLATCVYAERDSGGYLTQPSPIYTPPSGIVIAAMHNMQALINEPEAESETAGYRNIKKGFLSCTAGNFSAEFIMQTRIRLGGQDETRAYVNDRGMATIINVTNY